MVDTAEDITESEETTQPESVNEPKETAQPEKAAQPEAVTQHQDAVHLPITVGTEVQIELIKMNCRLKSELIGLEEGEFLILKLTHCDPCGMLSSDKVSGSIILVRYMFHGAIYGFKTKVLNMIYRPERMIFVEYPTKIEEHNVRTEQRYDCVMQAECTSGEMTTELIITDISVKGCRCIILTTLIENKGELLKQINMDATIDMKVPIPSSEEFFNVNGTIRNINRDETEIIFGISFNDIPPDEKSKFDRLINILASITGEHHR